MSYRILFLINAFVAVLFGAAFLFVPSIAIKRFGVDNYASTKMVTEFFGTALIALGILLWFAKDVSEETVQRGMGIALLIGSIAGLIVTVLGTTGRAMRANGWIAMLIYVLFALGYGFLIFLKPRMKE